MKNSVWTVLACVVLLGACHHEEPVTDDQGTGVGTDLGGDGMPNPSGFDVQPTALQTISVTRGASLLSAAVNSRPRTS